MLSEMDSSDLCPGGISAWSYTRCAGGGDCLHDNVTIKQESHRVRMMNTNLKVVLMELNVTLLILNSIRRIFMRLT